MNRRTILKTVAAGSIVPAAHIGKQTVASEPADTTAADSDMTTDSDTTADHEDTPVAVRIVEIPETVTGGAVLEWTVEVENPTDQSIRPTIEYTVDGEPAGNVTLTVGPGETERPFPSSYRTEPVPEDDEVTVRADANGETDERTVGIRATDELDPELQFPDPEPAVQPETTVHFEVGAVDPDAVQTTTWWIDGENVGDTLADPWQGVYYVEQAAHYWQETFESDGHDKRDETYEVVAGVDVDGEQYRASWTITVTPTGLEDPTIDTARPAPGPLEISPGGMTLEIDVSDPDGNLERVVWWLTQADRILGVSDVSGASDTATLSVDSGRCHSCQLIPWVITADGTFTAEPLWEFVEPGIDPDGAGLETESF
ncbi:hypothetical protein [Natronorubrum bangense]|uniref:Uncharacterized protein n=3 Tax=Natronorubrum bangense TaxID=61858 RepID=L9WRZ7_9EURY|nr:hypothetical protein [Natronorubrum bangense]ELY52202.1 hypothetical protein C494_01562 [Natronorubrum bangense JCM 10635]QCC55310.1 hypothetical protein DV706_13045 [Natronorubrum bangense]